MFVAPRILQFETPEELNSSWRGQVLPKQISSLTPSKYDRQIVLQLDDSANSTKAARFLNNRHPQSKWLVLKNNELKGTDGTTVTQLTADEWGTKPRIVLVGTFRHDQLTLGGKSATEITEMIRNLTVVRETSVSWIDWLLGRTFCPIARIKIIGWQSEASQTTDFHALRNSGMRTFSTRLAGSLKKQNTSAESIKIYDGPVEVDVLGRTWITNLQSGALENHSPAVRFLVALERNQAVIKPMPFEEMVIDAAEWDQMSGWNNDGNALNQAPPLSVGKVERRAIVLVTPEDVLKTNAPSDFQEAVNALLQKHPESEVYAISKGRNGNFQQWKFNTNSTQSEWKPNWENLQEVILTGLYDKVELLGHGDPKEGRIGDMSYNEVIKEFSKLMGTAAGIKHLSILACCTPLEFGVTLYAQLAAGNHANTSGYFIKEITLSENPISGSIKEFVGKK